MKNFLIGQHGGFDYSKFHRDFRKDFFGIEACMFPNEKEANILVEEATKNNFSIGIHFSLFNGTYKMRDPLLLSQDREERERAYEAFEKEIIYASKINAAYILVHFPKPVLLDRNLNWNNWRFGSREEYMYIDEYPFKDFRKNSEEMFYRLSELSVKYGVRVVLEHDAVNKYLYETTILDELLESYKDIKMCIDTGRLHILESVDKSFNCKDFIKRMAPYTYLVHLWNVKINDALTNSHYPALPSLRVEDGWADIKGYLNTIVQINRDIKILFEHRSDLISDEELDICYNWIDEIVNK